ncbi:hypothetical protein [Mesorhizobium sp. Mes31]|nr:hypothetical protein [Mesorhizobium sp. Mes31]
MQVGPKHGGKVNAQAERRSTERAVWAVPSVRVVEDRIAVA